jgi:MraZ protein
MGQRGTFSKEIYQKSGFEQIVTENPEQPAAGEAETSNEAAGGSVGAWDDLQTGFSGNPKTKLDERGRLKMPAEFKAFIDKKYGKTFNTFYITSRDGVSAEIYPMPEWLKHQAKIFKIPQSIPARQKLLDRYNLWGDRVDMDPQGRLLLPEELRNEGVLVGDVKVSGEGNFLRLTSLRKLRETVRQAPLDTQDVVDLTKYEV